MLDAHMLFANNMMYIEFQDCATQNECKDPIIKNNCTELITSGKSKRTLIKPSQHNNENNVNPLLSPFHS